MPTLQTEPLAFESRYKNTATLKSHTDKKMFEMWERPADLDNLLPFSTEYTVREVDIGRLDLIAYDFYRNVNLWWIIAAVNNIINPFTDLYAGQIIYIPAQEEVQIMLNKSGIITDETGS